MKALTLTQPWASLVAIGAKRLETRSWSTSYRGPLAIHAAKGFPRWARETCYQQPFAGALGRGGFNSPHDLPVSAFVALVDLVDVVTTESVSPTLHDRERAFGDYARGRFAWILSRPRPIEPAIRAKGALGLWTPAPLALEGAP